MVGRSAGINGYSDYVRAGFPVVPVPEDARDNWTMIHAISRQESQFDRAAVSRAGARGLMQLMPGTAHDTSIKIGATYDIGGLITDTQYNIRLGSWLFARLMDRYSGNYVLAVAAYNAGPGNVNKWLAANGDPRNGTDVLQWIEAIPFSETRGYVERVLENAVVYDMIDPSKARVRSNTPLSMYLGKRTPG
jgi:soluble lytic murein transglycosylase